MKTMAKLAIAVALLGGISCAEEGSERLKKFMVERVDTTQEAYEQVVVLYRNGFRSMEDVMKALSAISRAKLELCSSKAERIQVHEELIKAADEQEKIVKARTEAGQAGPTDQTVVKLHRLEAKIALEKEKLAK